jgi:hypothetical protein
MQALCQFSIGELPRMGGFLNLRRAHSGALRLYDTQQEATLQKGRFFGRLEN